MSARIRVTYTRTYDHHPLVDLDGDVFNGVTRTPAELRALATALIAAANAAEARPTTGRHWAPLETALHMGAAG